MKSNQYPLKTGQTVHLRFKHWFVPKGSLGQVVKQRRDKRCASGLRVLAKFQDGRGDVSALDIDAHWYKEVKRNFVMPPRK